MGQAKARKAAELVSRPWRTHTYSEIPKDLIARAVREPLLHDMLLQCWETAGSCIYQAEIGRRILVERFKLDAVVFVGEFMRPMGDGMLHTYTGEDSKICVETEARHAWVYCKTTGEYVDFAAWETPRRMEAHGSTWTGPQPDYLWDTPAALRSRGYRDVIDKAASIDVAANLRRGKDADFLRLYLCSALAVLDDGMRALHSTAGQQSAAPQPLGNPGRPSSAPWRRRSGR